jgi:hypothetical protein
MPKEYKPKPLTRQQQKALHLFFRLLADKLNEAGLDQRKVLKPSISIPWTPYSTKEFLWRPIQKAMTGKYSTTTLNKQDEINHIHEVLMRELGLAFHIDNIPFPSDEAKEQDYHYKKPSLKK